MATITVKAKGDLGIHPFHGPILAGEMYTIDESQWTEELFERPVTKSTDMPAVEPEIAAETTGETKGRK
jgi:hypothetical protein